MSQVDPDRPVLARLRSDLGVHADVVRFLEQFDDAEIEVISRICLQAKRNRDRAIKDAISRSLGSLPGVVRRSFQRSQ
ncbi:hypothetical protein [Antrihabitans stalactiti]|uniref:Uncharacterized protein n=1 Tax=Antrihabitans stalactiti TaxID=2584121 RepID=A0A848KBA7_9NOCA|nr:hypothetical protein [Antrihabitans stalactiti]NMN96155.1 hypothetical protein [Antrihabitans stalactiti]